MIQSKQEKLSFYVFFFFISKREKLERKDGMNGGSFVAFAEAGRGQ